MRVRIGTRGSDLALWQANHVAARLAKAGVETEIVVLKTRGDAIDDVPLTGVEGVGFFTAEIEKALLEGRVDLAVHSGKDLPTEGPPELVVAATPARGPQGERLLVAPAAHDPEGAFLPLAPRARVGTSAPRRAEQLLALRPDLEVLSLRGNVPTRVRRLREGRFDAIVLAAAGLERLGLDTSGLVEVELPGEWFVPAPAQGALAIQVRASDGELAALVREHMDDAVTARAVAAERRLLVAAGGGCNLPLGAAVERLAGGRWRARAFLGADRPAAGHPARWARVEAPGPEDAIEAALATLAQREPTGCGPFAGLTVALCGSAEGQGLLAARLSALGARVSHEAVIEFEDLPAPRLKPALEAMRPGDALAVTSRQTARYLAGLVVPAGVTVAAVGPATARALEEVGVRVDVVGSGGARELAAALSVAPRSRVLFPCAEGARTEIEDSLRPLGVEVERVALYRTLARPDASPAEDADVRVYMSPSAVAATLAWELARPRSATLRVALGRATWGALSEAGLAASEPRVAGPEGVVQLLAGLFTPRIGAKLQSQP